MTANFYIHLLKAFQSTIGERLAYIEGQGFFFVETYSNEQGTQHTFHSIDGLTTITNIPQEKHIYFLDNEKSLAELVRNVVGTPALHGRNVFGTSAQGWRYVTGNTELSAAQQAIAEKYGIEDIAESYTNEYYKQILRELRKLTIEAIEKATRNKKSKKNILLIWDNIKQLAQENDFVGLEEQRDELLKLTGKQKRGENAALIREAKKEIREEIWHKVTRTLKIWTTVIVFFSLTGYGVSYYFLSAKQTDLPVQNEFIQIPPLTSERIDSMIDAHNSQGKNIIYNWRRENIKHFLLSNYTTLTDGELKKAIDTLATTKYKFWKQ